VYIYFSQLVVYCGKSGIISYQTCTISHYVTGNKQTFSSVEISASLCVMCNGA